MPTTYVVEYAKSGRGSCKKSKEKIEKGEIRIGSESHDEENDKTFTSWYKPRYFPLPKKFKELGALGFVEEHLEDRSLDNSILPDKAEQLAEWIEEKPVVKKAGGGGSGSALIDKLKAEFEASSGKKNKKGQKRKAEDDDDAKENKKPKTEDEATPTALALYEKYNAMTIDQLKDYLRWNRQVLKGTKAVLLHKCIDGELNGRLKEIPEGKLKINDACTKVDCAGRFDDEMQARIPSDVTYSFETAPRVHPWYTQKPTEEEDKELDRLAEVAKGEVEDDANEDEENEDSDLGKLLQAAKGELEHLDLVGDIKGSCRRVVDFLEDSEAPLDLPEEEKQIRVAIGKILLEFRDEKTPSIAAILKKIVKKFGFVGDKKKQQANKEAQAAEDVACPENAGLYLALKELAQLYFKERNSNAGGSYMKASAAIKELKVVVTEDNAKGMGKAGKTKVANIGKGTAEKMYEFVTTGTIEKLEEKRAANA